MAEAEHQDAAGARKRTTSFADDQSKGTGVKYVRACVAGVISLRIWRGSPAAIC